MMIKRPRHPSPTPVSLAAGWHRRSDSGRVWDFSQAHKESHGHPDVCFGESLIDFSPGSRGSLASISGSSDLQLTHDHDALAGIRFELFSCASRASRSAKDSLFKTDLRGTPEG
jgi:hypothetical protein